MVSRARERKLLVDTDDQGQDAFLLGVNPQFGLAEVVTNGKPLKQAMHQALFEQGRI